ncbi:hypothetical protein DC522_05690 [Microvirga sp. KLBC 81]|uniref:hypothetical protein n=1 Tax=Microvirga sp. KLBC 81 TaxID=1862707 RepID=UPI000D509746|nr:hypothetical protein [Microvirga sp. KLBC 81]PVE25389.1 hypothetical protein DC522_05690 [Microvirga sp. KLBC 81]
MSGLPENAKPIETAPKDGTLFRALHELDPEREVQGRWNGENWQVSEFFIDTKTFYMYTRPTHWAPFSALALGQGE